MDRDRLSFLNKMIRELQQRSSSIVKPEKVYKPDPPCPALTPRTFEVLTYETADSSLHEKLVSFFNGLGYSVSFSKEEMEYEGEDLMFSVDVLKHESEEELQKRKMEYEAKLEEYKVKQKGYHEYLSAMEKYNRVDKPLVEHMSEMINVLKQEINKILEENGIQKNKKKGKA